MGTTDSIKVALGIGKVLFGVHSSKGLKKSLHCFLSPNGQCPIARGGGGTLGISGWGCAAGTLGPWDPGTLEPLTYTRPSSAEFCYHILE